MPEALNSGVSSDRIKLANSPLENLESNQNCAKVTFDSTMVLIAVSMMDEAVMFKCEPTAVQAGF